MKPRLTRPLALVGLLLLAAGGARLAPALCGKTAPAASGEPATDATRRVVLVELFTSQGCSSCPPADRLLTRLGQGSAIDGARVVPLAFHVDYWNHIGWTDPFSSAAWSQRQQRYGRRFALRSIYTPQLVIDGESECVGSNERQVRGLIAAAARRDSGGRIALESRRLGERELELRITAELRPPAHGSQIEAWVALVENGLSTAVGRGENASRTLRNDHVVRRLERVLTLEPAADSHGVADLKLEVEPSWAREHLGAVAFLQDAGTLAILDVAILDAGKLSLSG